MQFNKLIFILIFIVLIYNCVDRSQVKSDKIEFYSGGDISTLLKLEKLGAVYKDNGIEKDALQIFKDHGMNCIRLRLFHSPNDSGPVCNSLAYTMEFAKRIKENKMKFMLDFHYSDTWADPSKQYIPWTWRNLDYPILKDSVYQYTKHVITSLKKQNTLPDLVQIGNEISNGMLWNVGRVGGEFDTEEQWNKFSGLVKAGIKGVQDCLTNNENIKILIHFDEGSKQKRNKWFFDNLFKRGIDCDFICVSYYPMFHGSMDELTANLSFLAETYKKDIIVVETGYPWAVHPDWPLDPEKYKFPGTPEGQKAFLDTMVQIVKNIPEDRGKGLVYWAPEWVLTKAGGEKMTSPTFARMALFDFDGNALPGLEAFNLKQTQLW